jgi:hypothetical protein
VVEAEQFVLRDRAGRARAILSVEGESPAFQLLDAEGLPRIMILVDPCGRALIRLENAGGASVGMSVDGSGSVGLSLSRQGGMPSFQIGCSQGEELTLVVYDREGRPVWQSFAPVLRSGV